MNRTGLVMVPEGRKVFAPLSVDENLSVGGFTNRPKKRRIELIDQVYAMFPHPEGSPGPGGRLPQRRRTADAGVRPGHDGGAERPS